MMLDRIIRQFDTLLISVTGLLLAVAAVGAVFLPTETPTGRSATPAWANPSPIAQKQASPKNSPGRWPRELRVPSIGITAPIRDIEVTPQGVLDPPRDLSLVGWWKRSAKAGATRGQTVVTGHSASSAKGVMDDLPKVQNGAKVLVETPRSTVEYIVTHQVELNQEELAAAAEDLFGQDRRDNRLVMVTCSDYRNGVWNQNVIVFANPVKVTPKKA